MISIAITLLVLGLLGAAILRRHLHQAKLLRLREMLHKERMAAMERDLHVPDGDATRIESLIADGGGAPVDSHRLSSAGVRWIRLVALALGLTGVFGGIGVMPGFYYLADPEASGMWTLGLIPLLIGTGLLLFVPLSRGMVDNGNGKQEPR